MEFTKTGTKRVGEFAQKNSISSENKKLKEEKRDPEHNKVKQIRQDPHDENSKNTSMNDYSFTDQNPNPTAHAAELYYASALQQEMDEEGPISFQ